MNVICCSVNVDVVLALGGGGDTSTAHAVLELFALSGCRDQKKKKGSLDCLCCLLHSAFAPYCLPCFHALYSLPWHPSCPAFVPNHCCLCVLPQPWNHSWQGWYGHPQPPGCKGKKVWYKGRDKGFNGIAQKVGTKAGCKVAFASFMPFTSCIECALQTLPSCPLFPTFCTQSVLCLGALHTLPWCPLCPAFAPFVMLCLYALHIQPLCPLHPAFVPFMFCLCTLSLCPLDPAFVPFMSCLFTLPLCPPLHPLSCFTFIQCTLWNFHHLNWKAWRLPSTSLPEYGCPFVTESQVTNWQLFSGIST